MTEEQAGEAILQYWESRWVSAFPSVPCVYDDEQPNSTDEFVRLTIIPVDRENKTIGVQRLANTGFISVQVFTRPNIGAKRARALADGVRQILENRFIASPLEGDEPVCVYAGSSQNPTNDGAWSMRLVNLRFRFDEVNRNFGLEEGVASSSKNYRYTATGGETSVAFTFPEARANANYNAYCQLDGASDAFVTPDTTSFTADGFTFVCGAALTAGDVVMIEVEDLS